MANITAVTKLPSKRDVAILDTGAVLAYAPNAGTLAVINRLDDGKIQIKIELFDDNGDEVFATERRFTNFSAATTALAAL